MRKSIAATTAIAVVLLIGAPAKQAEAMPAPSPNQLGLGAGPVTNTVVAFVAPGAAAGVQSGACTGPIRIGAGAVVTGEAVPGGDGVVPGGAVPGGAGGKAGLTTAWRG